jgi:hypothetical protein
VQEIVVIVAGLALGAGATRVAAPRLRAAVIVIGAVVLGTAWSRIVGEAEALALWDITQALVAALAAVALIGARRALRAEGGRPR